MVSYNSKQNSDFTEKRGKTMFFKKLAAMFAAVFGFAASLVTVYAGDNSIAGPVMWLLIGSGVLIVAVVVLSVLGKKKK